MPSKRRLVTSDICFVTENAGLLGFSYNKCALILMLYDEHKKICCRLFVKDIPILLLFLISKTLVFIRKIPNYDYCKRRKPTSLTKMYLLLIYEL